MTDQHMSRASATGTWRWFSRLFWLALVMTALVACDTAIPTVPPITVNITAIHDTTAVAVGVQEALTATDQANLAASATIAAQGGVTWTPSPTPTATLTPTVTVTRFVTPTPTPSPTESPTATYAPYLTNTPGPTDESSNAWLRVINAWRDIGTTDQQNTVDVYVNNERVSRALKFGNQTDYLRVLAGSVRVTIRNVDPDVSNVITTPPLMSSVLDVQPGGVVSVVALNRGKGLELVPVVEDSSPLPTGLARLTILQANPTLLETNFLLPSQGRALAYNLNPGDLVGPFDLPPGSYPASLYDAQQPDQLVMSLPNPISLANRVNYLMVLVEPGLSNTELTDALLFSGITRRVDTDLTVRFVNISTRALTGFLDGQLQFQELPVGAVSDAIPVSRLGSVFILDDPQHRQLLQTPLGPWTKPEDVGTEKIVLLGDGAPQGDLIPIDPVLFSQDAPPSAINASIRLIHALPNTRPLTLQIRPVQTRSVVNPLGTPQAQQIGEDEIPWIPVGDANQSGAASNYASRIPAIYDVRVVLSGTKDVIANQLTVQFLPGGVYDFVVLPGSDTGSSNLTLIEPDTQFSGLGSAADNATAVYEAVNATLTAQSPQVAASPTRVDTPTPTKTPVPTNTPRPTNTPNIVPPSILVEPAPPNTSVTTLTLSGQDFTPGVTFTVTFDSDTTVVARGTIGDDGALPSTTITLPGNTSPGSHVLTVCGNCSSRTPQLAYTVFLVADANETPTATVTPS